MVNETIGNASSGIASGYNAIPGLEMMVILVSLVIVVVVLSNYERFAWLADKLRLLRVSLGYAGYGLVTVVALLIPVALVWTLSRAQRATQGEFGKWVGLAFVAYLALVAVGYVAKPVWQRGHSYASRYYEEEVTTDD